MQKKEKNTKKCIGRPKKKLDIKEINKLIDNQLSERAIADIAGCALSTIQSRFRSKLQKRKNEAIKARVALRQELRKAQWEAAIKDKNPVMLIWMGKNELGQADKIETTENRPKTKIRRTHN